MLNKWNVWKIIYKNKQTKNMQEWNQDENWMNIVLYMNGEK